MLSAAKPQERIQIAARLDAARYPLNEETDLQAPFFYTVCRAEQTKGRIAEPRTALAFIAHRLLLICGTAVFWWQQLFGMASRASWYWRWTS
jgi:hypothetical protein